MKYKILGKSGLNVSSICFGTLTMSPLQKKMSINDGSKLLKYAFDKGINFLDTAELYNNYEYINEFLKSTKREDVNVITKSYAYDKTTAENSMFKAMKEMKIDYIDGFLLHEQESEHTIRGHMEAIEYFIRAKEKGYIRSFGISTHSVNCVLACLKYDFIDIIHPLFNKTGIGILDGSCEDMLDAIKKTKLKNIGIYTMKSLGGGNLINSYDEALDYVVSVDEIDSIAIGMQSKDEIDANICKVEGKIIPNFIKDKLVNQNRKIIISDWCTGCGNCEKACSQKAIKIIDKRAKVNYDKCLLCSYCAAYCKEFCIKII